MTNDDTFIRITNQDIYKEIVNFKKENQKQHEEILIHQKHTNGKVKLNKWIATTALSIVVILIGFIAQNI